MVLIAAFVLLESSQWMGVASAAVPLDPTGKNVAFIQVTGNEKVDSNVVMTAIRTKPGDAWTAEKVRQDLRLIYETGYFADVNADITVVPEGVKVVYTVKENPVLKSVSVSGNAVVKAEKILSYVTLTKGTVVNTKALETNLQSIEEYYKSQGYILAKTGDAKIAPDGNLIIRINEGIVEDIVVKGNQKTKSYVITREMKLKKGQPFNSKDARRSMQKLYNLGYFEDVNVKLQPGRAPGASIVEVTVVEQKTGTFSIGGGYSHSDGVVALLSVSDRNFRGTGDTISVQGEFGGKAQTAGNYQFSYVHPWLDQKQTSLSLNVYNTIHQLIDYSESGDEISTYDKRVQGFDLTLGRPVNENLWYYIGFKNRRDEWKQAVSGTDYSTITDPSNTRYIPNNFGLTRSISLVRVLDTRDSVSNPSVGARYALTAEFAGFGGDFSFNKYTAEARRYWKSGKNNVLAVRAVLGIGSGYIPELQKYAIGGSNTLRGYRDEQFKGDRMFAATLEYRFPIYKQVHTALFVDVGDAWMSGIKTMSLKTGIGIGLRINSMFGPIRLDYAWGSQGGRAHFGFGGQF